MEDGLREDVNFAIDTRNIRVLILVLMEDGLRVVRYHFYKIVLIGLNPCFNGRWSARMP